MYPTHPGYTMNQAQVIAALRDILSAANASDSDNPPDLGGNDLPPECASERNGLYGFAMAALINLGQGASYAHYVRCGEWLNPEQLTQYDLDQLENDIPEARRLVNS